MCADLVGRGGGRSQPQPGQLAVISVLNDAVVIVNTIVEDMTVVEDM